MLFNSYIFILLFLPLSVLGYFLLNKTRKYNIANLFLIGMSFWFYGYYNPKYLLVICISIGINFFFSKLVNYFNNIWIKKGTLVLGILLNVCYLFYFKYYNFFIDNVNKTFQLSFDIKNVILPLGISFFTFQQVAYLVDSYRGQTKEYGFIEYALFVTFFPKLVQGPIVLHKEIFPQFRDVEKRKFSFLNVSNGLYIFALGLFKKVIVADTFGKAVSWGYGAVDAMTSMDAILVSLFYTFQLYFDFSGYCDMAIGIGYMFNITLPQNFNSPYKATSIVDFWSRWHMTLTRFLREYIYFPLGGSKKGKVRTYINILIIFLVSGIWHGANWTFIIWGILHGFLNCLIRILNKQWNKLHIIIQWFITFCFIDVLWIIFRAENITQAKQIIKRIIRLENLSLSSELADCFILPELNFLEQFEWMQYITLRTNKLGLCIFVFIGFFIVLNLRNSFEIRFKNSITQGITTVLFLVWSIMSLSGISEFLYINF